MNSKMVGLFAIVLIALMVAGFAYAMWTETINISGTVSTGDLDVSWSVGEGYDSEDEYPEKDVSSISGDVSEDGNTLYVTIENAYPCIHYYLPIDVSNDGSIPVIISDIIVDKGNLPEGCTVEINENIYEGVQIDAGDSVEGLLHVHLTNDVEEDSTYTFSVTLTVVQWNEYQAP
ncbi:MAG: hypothetical protein QXP36_02600 [Conexivisphaerales archaeon]